MKQVWKCDHCYKTDEKSEVIQSHEPKCTSNPDIKGCWTCVHHVDEGYPISGPMYACQKGKSISDMDDFDNGGCEIWETDEEDSCSCDNGIIDCPGCKDAERLKDKINCAGCKGSGKVTCGKCGGK